MPAKNICGQENVSILYLNAFILQILHAFMHLELGTIQIKLYISHRSKNNPHLFTNLTSNLQFTVN